MGSSCGQGVLQYKVSCMMQGVASMLMGLHADTLSDLQPRNPHNEVSWSFPPSIFLRSSDDEEDVIKRINMTAAALQAKVTSHGIMLCTCLGCGAAEGGSAQCERLLWTDAGHNSNCD